jgi:hypothetical protein
MSSEVKCPKCDSTQLSANKKGFSGKKAVGGAILTGGIGLLAGTIGSNKIIITCLACGNQFKPGQGTSGNVSSVQIKKTITPEQAERNKRINKKIFLYFFLPVVAIIVIAKLLPANDVKTAAVSNVQPRVWDIPKLTGKNIDQIRKEIGQPTDQKQTEPTKQQLKILDSWDNSWDKDGYSLLIQFNPKTRRVTEFFIATNDPSGSTTEPLNLVDVGMLGDLDKTVYTIQPVKSITEEGKYTGLSIKPIY